MGVEGVLTLNSLNKKYCKQQLSKTLTTKEKCRGVIIQILKGFATMLYAYLEQTTFIAFELANSVMIVHEFQWLGNCIVARILYFITRAKIYIAPNLNFQEDSSNLSSYYLVNLSLFSQFALLYPTLFFLLVLLNGTTKENI